MEAIMICRPQDSREVRDDERNWGNDELSNYAWPPIEDEAKASLRNLCEAKLSLVSRLPSVSMVSSNGRGLIQALGSVYRR